MCKELDIDASGLLIDEMKELIKREADRRFDNKDYFISADKLSENLLKFLTLEYDFRIYDKDGLELNWNYMREEL